MIDKIGVIDVGGGSRGVYACGILDRCYDDKVCFNLGIGVSAGSANLASFVSSQPRRNLKFYTEFSRRKEYMGLSCLMHKKSFIDLDYIYGTLSITGGESPLDYKSMIKNPMDFIIVATNAKTGKPTYFNKDDFHQDNYDILKASSAIPFVCQPYIINDTPYYDGALSDPVPVEKAFECGCNKVVLILTLPENAVRKSTTDKKFAKKISKKYPLAANELEHRLETYNKGITLAKEYEKQGKLLIIAPDDTCGVDTITRNPKSIGMLYAKGYKDGNKIKKFLNK